MNFDEFRQASKRTMRFEPEQRANAALGLVGELGEWLAAETKEKQKEEAGDALFYLAWLYEFYDIRAVVDTSMHYRISQHAAHIADIVKKHVFHDKEPDLNKLALYLNNIYTSFVIDYGDQLSDIYQANIARLLFRHPIEKGYTNEGQNARADEIIKQCNPCACDRGGDIWHKIVDGYHALSCSYCGFGTCDKDVTMAIEKWNSINIDAPVTLDPCGNCGTTEHIRIGERLQPDFTILDAIGCKKCYVHVEGETADVFEKWNARQAEIRHGNAMMRHVTAHTQSGDTEQTASAAIAANPWFAIPVQAEIAHPVTIYHVPTLPLPQQPVLLWIDHRWIEARYNGHGLWVYDSIYGYSREVKDGQYWQHLPTFNPESE